MQSEETFPSHRRISRLLGFVQLATVCITFFIDIASLGMCTIALPTIQDDLKFDEGSLQWVLTAYSLTYGGFLMVGGRLGDIFGQALMLKLAMLAFNGFTLMCALVQNDIAFLVGRALQGWAAAFTIPCAQAQIARVFPSPKAHAFALSWWGASGSMGFVLGPIIGGLFTSLASWRWIFWFPLIAEGTLLIIAIFLIRDPPNENRKNQSLAEIIEQIDPVGTTLSIPGLILIIYALTSGNQLGWANGGVIATLVVAVVLLVAFAFAEAKIAKHPLLVKHLWTSSSLPLGCALAAITYAVWQGVNYILTIQLQDLGFSALGTSIRFLPLGVTAFLVNMIIPHLLRPVGARILLLTSWLLAIAGTVLLSFLDSTADYWRFCFPGMILYILGAGTVYFVSMVEVVTSAPAKDQGSVAGIFNMALNIGGAVLGVAVLTVIDDSVTSNNGGLASASARLRGYQAAYYASAAWAALAFILSGFFITSHKNAADQQDLSLRSTASDAKSEDAKNAVPKDV